MPGPLARHPIHRPPGDHMQKIITPASASWRSEAFSQPAKCQVWQKVSNEHKHERTPARTHTKESRARARAHSQKNVSGRRIGLTWQLASGAAKLRPCSTAASFTLNGASALVPRATCSGVAEGSIVLGWQSYAKHMVCQILGLPNILVYSIDLSAWEQRLMQCIRASSPGPRHSQTQLCCH